MKENLRRDMVGEVQGNKRGYVAIGELIRLDSHAMLSAMATARRKRRRYALLAGEELYNSSTLE